MEGNSCHYKPWLPLYLKMRSLVSLNLIRLEKTQIVIPTDLSATWGCFYYNRTRTTAQNISYNHLRSLPTFPFSLEIWEITYIKIPWGIELIFENMNPNFLYIKQIYHFHYINLRMPFNLMLKFLITYFLYSFTHIKTKQVKIFLYLFLNGSLLFNTS